MKLVKINRNNCDYPMNNSFFNDFFNNELDFYTPRASKFVPAVNVIEEEQEFKIEVAAPGMSKEDFKVNLDKNLLTIEATKEESKESENNNYSRREFGYNSFSRSFNLPNSIDATKIDAKYENGVLNILLPKKEEAIQPSRLIDIS